MGFGQIYYDLTGGNGENEGTSAPLRRAEKKESQKTAKNWKIPEKS